MLNGANEPSKVEGMIRRFSANAKQLVVSLQRAEIGIKNPARLQEMRKLLRLVRQAQSRAVLLVVESARYFPELEAQVDSFGGHLVSFDAYTLLQRRSLLLLHVHQAFPKQTPLSTKEMTVAIALNRLVLGANSNQASATTDKKCLDDVLDELGIRLNNIRGLAPVDDIDTLSRLLRYKEPVPGPIS